MFHLHVVKKNESFVHIMCEESISQELSDYFAFFAPGFMYTPLYKKKLWDGRIRLYNRQHSILPRGLISYLSLFAHERNYTLHIDDELLLTTNFSIAEAQAFAESLHLPYTPYDHQIEAFTKVIRYRRLLVVSPTASGKSLLMYLIVRWLQQTHQRGLIIVPNTSLVEQLFGDFTAYGWDSNKYVHRVYAGKDKTIKKFLTISTWQTAFRQTPEYLAQFDFVIGDEAHQFKAKQMSFIMEKLVNANVRIGTTGTLDGTKTHKLVLEGHFGPVFEPITTKQLMDDGKLAPLKIKCLVLKYPEAICKVLRKSTYPEEYAAVISHPSRSRFVRNLSLSLKGNTLVLFQLVALHGKPLFEDIKSHTTDHQVFFVCKDTKTEDRERIRQIAEENDNIIIVASYGTFSTGINIKNLHNVIFAAPSKSRIRNLQSIGRGLRKSEGKTHVTLFDIVDDLRIGKRVNFLLKHFIVRAAIYNNQKFSFKQYMIDLQ